MKARAHFLSRPPRPNPLKIKKLDHFHLFKANQFGLSLIELYVVLLIIFVGSLYAQPKLAKFIEQGRATTLSNHLVGLLHYSRIQALTHQKSVTLCQLEAGTCRVPWRVALTVFIDQPPIGNLNTGDTILLTTNLPAPLAVIYWRSFRRKPYLNFTAQGSTRSQNGHLITCIAPGASAAARKIVINQQGRTRVQRNTKNQPSNTKPGSRHWTKQC